MVQTTLKTGTQKLLVPTLVCLGVGSVTTEDVVVHTHYLGQSQIFTTEGVTYSNLVVATRAFLRGVTS